MAVVLSSTYCQPGPTSSRLPMAGQASSGGINGGNNRKDGDREIMLELMSAYLWSRRLIGGANGNGFVQQQQQRQQNGKRSGPLMEELSAAVLALTDDYERRYRTQLEDLRSNWIIDASCPRESFRQVLDNVFVDDCNWGRFVTIFVFASMFVRQCQQQGVNGVAPTDVCDWSVDYVALHVLPWIKRNGDWMGLIRFYKDGESSPDTAAAAAAAAAPGGGQGSGGSDSGVLTRLLTVAGAGIAIVGLTSFLRA